MRGPSEGGAAKALAAIEIVRQRPTRPQNKARLQASYSTRGESPLLRDEISPLSAVRLDRVSGLLILLLCVLLCRHQNEERERQEPARRSHGVCEGAPQAPVLVRCSCPEAASSDLDHRRQSTLRNCVFAPGNFLDPRIAPPRSGSRPYFVVAPNPLSASGPQCRHLSRQLLS